MASANPHKRFNQLCDWPQKSKKKKSKSEFDSIISHGKWKSVGKLYVKTGPEELYNRHKKKDLSHICLRQAT